MKRLKPLMMTLLLLLTFTVPALAAEVPENIVIENLNGQQRMVKTYVLPPEVDPSVLQEPPFEYDGYRYDWSYTTKDEEPYLETKTAAQAVTVETSSKDLSAILEQLDPTLPYDDGEFSGVLALDHTTLNTEAAGYTTRYSTTTETKVIGNLDRNDMSYVPATTVKNGITLSLVNVDWQVTGTDLVGEALVPSRYQAVATYSATTSYQAATGYVTTAQYTGEVTASGIEQITYTVVYTGTEIVSEPEGAAGTASDSAAGSLGSVLLPVLGVLLLLLLLAALGVLLLRRRKNVSVYIPGKQPRDYQLVAKFQVKPELPEIDISGTDAASAAVVAVEIHRALAKKLVGKVFSVHHPYGTHNYTVAQDTRADWHEFSLKEEESSCESENAVPEPSAE